MTAKLNVHCDMRWAFGETPYLGGAPHLTHSLSSEMKLHPQGRTWLFSTFLIQNKGYL